MKRVLLIMVLLLALTPATPAFGHSNEAKLEVLKAEPAGALSIHYDVMLSFAGDGHQVENATITMVAERPGRPALTPVLLEPVTQKGLYEGAISVPDPGEWTIRLTAVNPTATVERKEKFELALSDAIVVPTVPAEPAPAMDPPAEEDRAAWVLPAAGIGALVVLGALERPCGDDGATEPHDASRSEKDLFNCDLSYDNA